jgi:hypothetical protein
MKLLGYQLSKWIHSSQNMYDRYVIDESGTYRGFGIWFNYDLSVDNVWHLNFSARFKEAKKLYSGQKSFASITDGQQAIDQYLEQFEKLKAFC